MKYQVTPVDIQYAKECLARYHAWRTHDFDDETGYCRRCGQEDELTTVNAISCVAPANLTAISHRIRPYNPRLDQL